MFKKNEFKAALVRKDLNIEDVAKVLGIATSSVSRKINGQSDFFRDEIEKISAMLELTPEDILKIFFA